MRVGFGIIGMSALLLVSIGFAHSATEDLLATEDAELVESLAQFIAIERRPPTVSIVLLGRSGAGISQTVSQLLGPQTTIHQAHVAVASTDILEYTLRVPPPPEDEDFYYLKLVDIPGFDLDQADFEHDAEIIASLKAYLHDMGVPTFFVVVTKIDEPSISDKDSELTRLLSRVQYFQRALFDTTTDNTVFLLSRLMNEPLEVQQDPKQRISDFLKVIGDNTSFQPPYAILVGDNEPDYNPGMSVPIEDGWFKLPNNELYPKSLWEKLLEVATRSEMTRGHWYNITEHVVTFMIQSREKPQHTRQLVPHAEDQDMFESDIKAVKYAMSQDFLDVPSNEVQRQLHATNYKEEPNIQFESSLQFMALQLRLREEHIEGFHQLPQCTPALVKFFQIEGMTSKQTAHLLKQAFHLQVPAFPAKDLTVGHGYDVINDKILLNSPFKGSYVASRTLGFAFPDFITCEKLPIIQEKWLANVTNSMNDYYRQRLRDLNLAEDSDVVAHLKSEPKPYMNVKPVQPDKLFVFQEFRKLKCVLRSDRNNSLNDEFVSAVTSLPALNESNSESLLEWKSFLHSYGSHVVAEGFGGGWYHAELDIGTKSNESVEQTFDSIARFQVPDQEQSDALFYFFHKGNPNPRLNRLHQLDQSRRNRIVADWKHSLNVKFEMLRNELQLIPVSEVITNIDADKGVEAARATDLLLHGKLDTESREGEHEEDASSNSKIHRAKVQSLVLQATHFEEEMKRIREFNEAMDAVESNS